MCWMFGEHARNNREIRREHFLNVCNQKFPSSAEISETSFSTVSEHACSGRVLVTWDSPWDDIASSRGAAVLAWPVTDAVLTPVPSHDEHTHWRQGELHTLTKLGAFPPKQYEVP
jgi:hypothetical protein